MLRITNRTLHFNFSLIVLLLISSTSFADTNVLFIGNSYTYYNSMPQMFKAMAENLYPDQSFEVQFIGGGGATLKKHWEVGQALAEIKTGKWDFVVLQEQSALASNNIADSKSWKQFYKFSRKFDQEIKKNGGRTVFFMTWAKRDLRPQQKYLTTAYKSIADELEAIVAPVGLVWDNIRQQDSLELFDKDGSHPSAEGSFLIALTIFSSVFEIEPRNTSGKLVGHEILRGGTLSEKKSVLADIPVVEVHLMEEMLQKQIH